MPPQEQADLWMALRDRMKVNWAELTLQEKKAGTLDPLNTISFACSAVDYGMRHSKSRLRGLMGCN